LLPFFILGTLTKESFIPFSIMLTSSWWITSRRSKTLPLRNTSLPGEQEPRKTLLPGVVWTLISWGLSLATLIVLQRSITGEVVSPVQFGITLHQGHDYFTHFVSSLHDRNLFYVFIWLLPTALPNLMRLPKTWIIPVGATCVMAFVLDGYYGGAPGTVGRALFSVAGPVLSLSSHYYCCKPRTRPSCDHQTT
jgi:hypothetical protein